VVVVLIAGRSVPEDADQGQPFPPAAAPGAGRTTWRSVSAGDRARRAQEGFGGDVVFASSGANPAATRMNRREERAMRQVTRLLVPTLAASVLLAACGSSSSSSTASSAAAAVTTSGSASVFGVKTASDSTLHATVLINAGGLTLYRLSGEQNGKWICTSAACLGVWHPLTVSGHLVPKGSIGSLGTIKRPGGMRQVTVNGMPLYTFAGDTSPGQAKGQGVKDVGTWNAVSSSGQPVSSAAVPAASTSSSSSSAAGGGYGY
jgi:predicted lipoprotein with Yx(FWY)xxD motif